MANLYMLDQSSGKNGLHIAKNDDACEVVLLQDGVYLDVKPLMDSKAKVYAVKDDVIKRGLQERLPNSIELIDYSKLVDLIVANKVINFL